MIERIKKIQDIKDIPAQYQGTPAGQLIEYHNLDKPFNHYDRAEMVIGMCMDNRISLNLPPNFAYYIRTGGGNLKDHDFYISFAIAVGQAKCIAVVGHDKCGMADLYAQKDTFIKNLVDQAGWSRTDAEQHFSTYAPKHDIGDEADFVLSETNRLREQYPKITIVPMMYMLEDQKLYLVDEQLDSTKHCGCSLGCDCGA